jgi:DNA segregation ATPase FtsK/SpoIIIE, S-DNA-T family
MPGRKGSFQSPPEVPHIIPGNVVTKLMATDGGRHLTRNSSFPMSPMIIMSIAEMFMSGDGRPGKAAAGLNEEHKDCLRYLTDPCDDAQAR